MLVYLVITGTAYEDNRNVVGVFSSSEAAYACHRTWMDARSHEADFYAHVEQHHLQGPIVTIA